MYETERNANDPKKSEYGVKDRDDERYNAQSFKNTVQPLDPDFVQAKKSQRQYPRNDKQIGIHSHVNTAPISRCRKNCQADMRMKEITTSMKGKR
jgi:hypothetical protein